MDAAHMLWSFQENVPLDDRNLGQIYTPDRLAQLVAGWFRFDSESTVSILDPGAGHGALSEAVLGSSGLASASSVSLDMVEIDPVSAIGLRHDVPHWDLELSAEVSISNCDFVDFYAAALQSHKLYSHVIMNPPYVRTKPRSDLRRRLNKLGVRVTNLYGVFLWLGVDLLQPGGQLVAIVPRSFFSGNQFLALRQHIFSSSRIERIHHYQMRDNLFGRDGVLQENVIVKIVKSVAGGERVGYSSSSELEIPVTPPALYSHSAVVGSVEDDYVIRLPGNEPHDLVDRSTWASLIDIERGYRVRTGSVVDFRTPQVTVLDGADRVPLIDARVRGLLAPGSVVKEKRRFLVRDGLSSIHILPVDHYVVIRRFSPREQSPRLRAVVVTPESLTGRDGVAFENHVNVISREGGMSLEEAEGIVRLLATADVEQQFQELSGTTQVNVSDLRRLRVPHDVLRPVDIVSDVR